MTSSREIFPHPPELLTNGSPESMSEHCCTHSPVLCVLPPFILERIAQLGSSVQRQWAQRALLVSERLRGQRDSTSVLAGLALTPVGEKRRTIYDARGTDALPGRRIRSEGEPPTGDIAADEAYDGAGETFDLYFECFGRNSLDDRGLRLDSTVHYSHSFDNAFWNGAQMVYGDGDMDLPEAERLFNRFTISVDIIGHELTHGLTQHEANLLYMHQPGALNEHMSDVFGSLVKQRRLRQTAREADWLIGEGLFTAQVNAVAIRSLKAPGTAYDDKLLGKDPQPGHMRDYLKLRLWEDNGGVHLNSGIPNRAFYVVAHELGGHAWERAGRIWYYTLRDRLRRNSNFNHCARMTWLVAAELFGEGSVEQKAVETGWHEVGINCRNPLLDFVGIE